MDSAAHDDFKAAVRTYISLHDEILAGQKALAQVRKKKTELAQVILEFMKQHDIDECALADGKLVRKQTKKLESLKKEHILDELKRGLGLDGEKAESILVNIYSKRGVEAAESLRRTKARGGGAGVVAV